MQLTNSLVTICCNNVLSVAGGDIYISVMTIVSSVRQLVETPLHAINEGASPILSYNYGACRPKHVRKAGAILSVMVLVYTAVTWSMIILIPEFLIRIFSSDTVLLKDAVIALKQYFAAFIFMDLQYIGQTVFKSLNKKEICNLLLSAPQGIHCSSAYLPDAICCTWEPKACSWQNLCQM